LKLSSGHMNSGTQLQRNVHFLLYIRLHMNTESSPYLLTDTMQFLTATNCNSVT